MEGNSEKGTQESKMEKIYNDHGFFGHPKGLSVLGMGNLFNSVAWAAFNAIFIYYLYTPFSKGLGFTQGEATSIVAAMGVMNSMFGILGSWLSDRVLGMRTALVIGNITKAFGFACMAVPIVSQGQGKVLMFVGLLFLCMPIMGSSNNSLTAQLYRRSDDGRRDAAFTIHNVFNSIGGFVTPVIVGTIGQVNYHIGFAVAAVAALLYALVILVFSKKFFGDLGKHPVIPISKVALKKVGLIAAAIGVVLIVIILFVVFKGLMSFDALLNVIMSLAFIIPIIFFINLFTNKNITVDEKKTFKPMRKLLAVQIFQAVVWSVTGPATLLYMDVKINRMLGSFEFAPATFVSIGALFALIFNPVASYLWTATKAGNIRSLSKMALSYALGSITLFIIPLSMYLSTGKVNPLWYIACLLIDNLTGAIGGPAGISIMSKISPKAYVTQIQTAWGQCSTIGSGISILIFKVFDTADKQLALFPYIGIGLVLIGMYLRFDQKKLEAEMQVDD